MSVLKLESVSKKYVKTVVLKDINISVEKGKIYGLLGPNGAEKTTLFRIIAGLTKPNSGRILIDDSDENISEKRRKISFMIESPYLDFEMTAEENLHMMELIRDMKAHNGVKEVLDIVGLGDTGNKKVGKFSLGMKQRLGIAMALVLNPELMILDEPINGLDPIGVYEMRELLRKINRDTGMTIILSSHILGELDQLATDYILINRGRMIEQTTAEKIHKYGDLESYFIKKVGEMNEKSDKM